MREGVEIISERKPYMLVTVDAPAYDQVRHWFEEVSARFSLDTVFVGDMKPRSPFQAAIGFIALVKLDSGQDLRTVALEIRKEIERHEDWECQIMRADWVDVATFARGRSEEARRVTTDGRISFMNHRYFVTQRLRGEEVNLRINDGNLEVYHQGTLVKCFRIATER